VQNLSRGTVLVEAQQGNQLSTGTGAILHLPSGWEVVTAAHVVGQAKTVQVVSRDGSRQLARVVSADASHDVAVITVKAGRSWIGLPLSSSMPLPGQKVSTQCYFDSSLRQGVYVGPVRDQVVEGTHYASLDLPGMVNSSGLTDPRTGESVMALFGVQPGCSGAPLLDKDGAVIGIVLAGNDKTAIAVTTGSAL